MNPGPGLDTRWKFVTEEISGPDSRFEEPTDSAPLMLFQTPIERRPVDVVITDGQVGGFVQQIGGGLVAVRAAAETRSHGEVGRVEDWGSVGERLLLVVDGLIYASFQLYRKLS